MKLQKKQLIFSIVGVLGGFFIGFLIKAYWTGVYDWQQFIRLTLGAAFGSVVLVAGLLVANKNNKEE